MREPARRARRGPGLRDESDRDHRARATACSRPNGFGGYGGGLDQKRTLLALEGALLVA